MIGSPASTCVISGPENCILTSASPDDTPLVLSRGRSFLTYWTSLNPSLRRNSSATYFGAWHMPPAWISLILVVSRGGCAATASSGQPATAAAPARLTPFRNSRRLQWSSRFFLMDPPHLSDQPSAIP